MSRQDGRKRIRSLAAGFLINLSFVAIVLSGCVSQPLTKQAQQSQWRQYQANMLATNSWTAIGIVGIRLPNQAQSANFSWQQQGDRYLIQLYGPLGIGGTKLSGNAHEITLTDHDGKVYYSDNPEDLMQNTLGWSLPVSGLRYWIRAVPMPNGQYLATFKPNGLMATLEQEGWHIVFIDYQMQNGKTIVHKIRLVSSHLTATLVINALQVN